MTHHHHEYSGTAAELKAIRGITWIGLWVNLVMLLLKLIVGYLGHSDALVADGFHSLSDFSAAFVVLVFVGVAYRRADESHPYGHGKFETLASLLISVALFFVAVGILKEGIESVADAYRGIYPERPDVWTLAVALLAVCAKETLFRITRAVGCRTGSSALIANAWHERSDAISTIAMFLGVAGAYFLGESWRVLDPVASIFIGVVIGVSAIGIARPAFSQLMEKSLPEDEMKLIRDTALSVDEVIGVGYMRTRRNGKLRIADIELRMSPELSLREAHAIARRVEKELRAKMPWPVLASIHETPA